jgi:hypothetical protein
MGKVEKLNLDENELRRLYLEEDKSALELAELFNCSCTAICRYLKKYNIPLKKGKRKLKIGTEFADGNLVLVNYGVGTIDSTNGSIRQTYLVECKLCNNISEVRRSGLVQKSRKCCKFCMQKGIKNEKWKGCGELSGSQFYVNKYSAKVRNIPFDITIEEAWRQYEKQEGICALSGEEIKFNPDKGWVKRDITASLDRIDSSKGYTVDNIQWISKDIQKMKMDYTEDELRDWCKKVSDYQNGLVVYNNDLALIEWKHHKNWKGFGNIRSTMFSKYRRGANERKLSWNITIEDLWKLFLAHVGLCNLSGVPIDFAKNHKNTQLCTASLDRINSTIGYEFSNLQWVHKRLNEMKMDLEQNRFINLCKMISNRRLSVY